MGGSTDLNEGVHIARSSFSCQGFEFDVGSNWKPVEPSDACRFGPVESLMCHRVLDHLQRFDCTSE